MTDDAIDETTFFDTTDQLRKIREWAHARRVSTWALFFAILVRVAASTPPTVRLPGLIGGPASLNLFAAFVSRSGGGKGISDKVSRMAWPADIAIRHPGTGEGLTELFVLRGKESEDNERLMAAILTVNEIDALAGLASRQGSILLAQLKSAWMGESLGQANATKAASRHVAEHDYRLCLSVGCQYGHGGVIFADTSGGTPQRFLWALTEDPDMPYGGGPDPDPLDTSKPSWKSDEHGVSEIVYGIPEIEETIIGAHLARQRGQADALDGHALLSRCKVAADLAIMHQRQEVTALDWRLSEIVMAVSDRTRAALLEYDRQASRAKIRDRAISRAVGEDFYDDSRSETVKRSIMRMLDRDGEQAEGDLRRRLGKREKRELFDQAIALLERDGLVAKRDGSYNGRSYTYWSSMTGEVTHQNSRSTAVTQVVTHDHPATVTELDSRRSADSGRPKLSCQKWMNQHIAELRAAGHTTAESFAVYQAGQAARYTKASLSQAASAHPDIVVIKRGSRGATWSLTGDHAAAYVPAGEFFSNYIDRLPADRLEIDQDDYRQAAATAGYSWDAALRAATTHPRIESAPAHGNAINDRTWKIKPNATDGEVTA